MTTDEYDLARNAIEVYKTRFDRYYTGETGPHMAMARLASFPIAVTPQLLYAMHFNFSPYKLLHGTEVTIPPLAVADCLLSNLFSHRGSDIYEMDAHVRELLLDDLYNDLGETFVKSELASFLYQFSRKNTKGRLWRNFYEAQEWNSIMTVNPTRGARSIINALANEVMNKNTSRGIGIANLIQSFQRDKVDIATELRKFLENKEVGVKGELTGKKKVIISDKPIEGAATVTLEMPRVISKKLEGVLSVVGEGEKSEEGQRREGKVFAVFAAITEESRRVWSAEQTIMKLYSYLSTSELIVGESTALFIGKNATKEQFVDSVKRFRTLCQPNDVLMIFYLGLSEAEDLVFAGAERSSMKARLRAKDLPGILIGNPATTPYIFIFSDDNHGGNKVPGIGNPKVVCLTNGFPSKELEVGQLTNELVDAQFSKTTTLRELYRALVEDRINKFKNSKYNFYLPGLYAEDEAWDRPIFSPETSKADNKFEGDARYVDGQMRGEQGQVTRPFVQWSERIKKTSTVECTSLTYLKVSNIESDEEIHQIFKANKFNHQDFRWREIESLKIAKFAERLSQTDILFLGVSRPKRNTPYAGSADDQVRILTLAFNVLVYAVIEFTSGEIARQWRPFAYLPFSKTPLDRAGSIEELRSDVASMVQGIQSTRKESPREPAVYGLFCGIGSYDNLQPINSALDPKKLIDALVSTSIIDRKNAKVIISDTTRADVVSQFTTILRNARKDDVVIFYFSGHALNHESHRIYFAPAPTTRPAEEAVSITDEEFRTIIDNNAPDNPNVVLILDTHSGSRKWLDESNPKHVQIHATHPYEVCADTDDGGPLTDMLASLISNKGTSMSYRSLFRGLLETMIGAVDGQRATWQTPLVVVHSNVWDLPVFSHVIVESAMQDQPGYVQPYLLPNNAIRSPNQPVGLALDPESDKNKSQLHYPDGRIRVGFILKDLYRDIPVFFERSLSEMNCAAVMHDLKKVLSDSQQAKILPEFVKVFLDNTFTVLGISGDFLLDPMNLQLNKVMSVAFALNHPVFFVFEAPRYQGVNELAGNNFLGGGGVLQEGGGREGVLKDLKKIIEDLRRFVPIPKSNNVDAWAVVISVTKYKTLPALATNGAELFRNWLLGGAGIPADQISYVDLDENGTSDVIDKAIVDILRRIESMPTETRRFYLYVTGSGFSQANRRILFLPGVSDFFNNEALDLTKYVEGISSYVQEFAAFFDIENKFDPLVEGRGPAFSSRSRRADSKVFICWSRAYGTQSQEDPPAFVPFTRDLIRGLQGEAAGEDGKVTTDTLKRYFNSRSQRIDFEETGVSALVLAQVDPASLRKTTLVRFSKQFANHSFTVFKSNRSVDLLGLVTSRRMVLDLPLGTVTFSVRNDYRHQLQINRDTEDLQIFIGENPIEEWVLAVGTGNESFSTEENLMCRELGDILAHAGYGIIDGGWPGVDEAVCDAYLKYYADKKISLPKLAHRVVLSREDEKIVRLNGDPEFVNSFKDWIDYTVSKVVAVIVVGGKGGSYTIAERATSYGKLVYPIASTGGDAANLYQKLSSTLSKDLAPWLEYPIKTKANAGTIAAAILADLEQRTFPQPPVNA